MARATVKETHKVVTREYTLTLTEAEAQTLAVVMAMVGGDPDTTPRKHANAIANALYESGIFYRNTPQYPKYNGGSVIFGE